MLLVQLGIDMGPDGGSAGNVELGGGDNNLMAKWVH
jgi:hypothetical protein